MTVLHSNILCILIASLPIATVVHGCPYYVSSSNPNSSDDNPGIAMDAPWKSVEHAFAAIATFPADCELLFRNGDTWAVTWPANATFAPQGGITLASYSDDPSRTDRPHIARNMTANPVGATLVLIDGINLTLNGLHVSGGEQTLRIAYTTPGPTGGINITDCELDGARGFAPNATTGNGWGKSIQLVGTVPGVVIWNVSLTNNLIHDTDTFYINDIVPPPYPLSRTAVLNITVQGNTIQRASYNTLFLDSTQLVTVHGNVFTRDTPRALFNLGTTDILMGDINATSHGPSSITDNEIDWRGEWALGGPDGCAIDVETACEGVIVRGNYISGSYGAGIMVFDHTTRSQGLILDGNVFVADGCSQSSEDRGEIAFMKAGTSGIVSNSVFVPCPGEEVFHETVANASAGWVFVNNTINGTTSTSGTASSGSNGTTSGTNGAGMSVQVVVVLPAPNVTAVWSSSGLRVYANALPTNDSSTALNPDYASAYSVLLTYTADGSKPTVNSTPFPINTGYVDLPYRTTGVHVKAFPLATAQAADTTADTTADTSAGGDHHLDGNGDGSTVRLVAIAQAETDNGDTVTVVESVAAGGIMIAPTMQSSG